MNKHFTKILLIFSLFLLYAESIKKGSAQKSNYIIAGKYTNNDSLYVNNLQLLVNPNTHKEDSLTLDINRDNTFDIRINSYASLLMSSCFYASWLKSINTNFLYCYDSVYPRCNVKRFEYGDTIDHKLNWIRSVGYFAGYFLIFSQPPATIWGEWCNEPGYLGLMIISGSDTTYSWVHMQVTGYGQTVRLDSFVFQKRPVGIPKFNEKETFSIYPNPVNDIITVNSSILTKGIYTIIDINGRELIKQQFNQSYTQIDVSRLIKGLYFLKLENDKTIEVKKIIKE